MEARISPHSTLMPFTFLTCILGVMGGILNERMKTMNPLSSASLRLLRKMECMHPWEGGMCESTGGG